MEAWSVLLAYEVLLFVKMLIAMSFFVWKKKNGWAKGLADNHCAASQPEDTLLSKSVWGRGGGDVTSCVANHNIQLKEVENSQKKKFVENVFMTNL